MTMDLKPLDFEKICCHWNSRCLFFEECDINIGGVIKIASSYGAYKDYPDDLVCYILPGELFGNLSGSL